MPPIIMRRSIPILCYHAVDASADADGALGNPRALLEQHLDLIQNLGFVTISTSELLDLCAGRRPLDQRYLLLTFDDGHLSHWLDAAPMLAARGMRGVFFAVTDFIRPGRARSRTAAPPPQEAGRAFEGALRTGDCSPFMNESELAALVGDLGMEVHAHTAAHQGCFRSLRRTGSVAGQAHWTTWGIYPEPDASYPVFEHGSAYAYNGYWPRFHAGGTPAFRLRSDAERYAFCIDDVRRSFDRISAINRAPRQLLCWPWGEFDPVAERAAREAGFSGAFTMERSPNGPGTDPFRLGRIRVGPTKSAGWLRMRLGAHASVLGASALSKRFRKKPETLRVLYVTDSRHLSGGTRQLLNNVAAMAELGVQAFVAAPAGAAVTDALAGSGTPVITWDHPGHLFRSARFLADVARSRQLDVVHTFHSRPGKAAVLAKLVGGRFRLYLNRGVTYRPNPLIGAFAVIADGVICNSHAGARVLRSHLTPGRRVSVVYNSTVTVSERVRAAERRGPIRVIWVGNANPVKGYDVFRRVARRYAQRHPEPPVVFAAYGVDPGAEIARRAGEDGEGRVELQGPTSHEAVQQALAGADVFLLTSRRESLPNVLLEAFSAALPVVCTDVGGVAEVVHDGVNGWTLNAGDIDGLVNRLHDLIACPERRLAMGACNRQLALTSFNNTRKGGLLLRVYSGERIDDRVTIDGGAGGPTCAL